MAEDDSFLLDIFSKVLSLEGFELHLAKDGIAAKESLTKMQTPPSLFLLDIMMPGLSGFELFEFIKSEERFKNVPVVFLTNLYSDEDAQKVKEMGAKLYLLKSNNAPEDVVVKIKNLLKYIKTA